MCSWSVSTVIDFYNSKGAPLYGTAMDMSKAFDMVKWDEMFTSLRERHINPILLRILIRIYTKQKCNVSWNGEVSASFGVSNGMGQGGILSAIFLGDPAKQEAPLEQTVFVHLYTSKSIRLYTSKFKVCPYTSKSPC